MKAPDARVAIRPKEFAGLHELIAGRPALLHLMSAVQCAAVVHLPAIFDGFCYPYLAFIE